MRKRERARERTNKNWKHVWKSKREKAEQKVNDEPDNVEGWVRKELQKNVGTEKSEQSANTHVTFRNCESISLQKYDLQGILIFSRCDVLMQSLLIGHFFSSWVVYSQLKFMHSNFQRIIFFKKARLKSYQRNWLESSQFNITVIQPFGCS